MIVEAMKRSILKYAITGKLTQKEPSDTPAEFSFDEIQLKRKELFENKMITKNQYYVVKNEKKYKYDLPNYWLLTQVGYLGYVVGGGTPKTEIEAYFNGDIAWITPKDMKKFNKYVNYGERNITLEGLKNSGATMMPKGTVLCSSRAPIGYLGIAENDLSTNQGFKSIVPLCNVNSEYIYYYLLATIEDLKKSGDGTTFSEISGSDFAKFYIAFPPIEEQQRIVNKIEKLFAKLDELKPIEDKLALLKSTFPNDMKKSIMQYAISGKLTNQVECESVDLILSQIDKKITQVYNPPFEIPFNWKWIKFGELVDFCIGKTPTRSDLSYWGNDYNWVSIADMVDNGYISNTKEMVSEKAYNEIFKARLSKKGTLIMSFKLTVGKCSILAIDAFHNEGIISIYPKYESDILKQYLFYILPYLTKYGDTKGAIKGNTLNSKSLYNLLIPLPSIEEQQRILEKIKKVLPLCENVKQIINN